MARRRSVITAFLDSSVLFTAINSPFGGSAKLFTLPKLKLLVSSVVLTEVERNVRNKLTKLHLQRFFTLINQLQIITQSPDAKSIQAAQKVIVSKDVVILAEVKRVRPQYLVTLDQKHFLQPAVAKFIEPTIIVTPKMMILHIRIGS